jgi:hypothetical protein
VRIERIKNIYPENYDDHIKNMKHISENDTLIFPKKDTFYIDTNIELSELKKMLISYLDE